MQKKRAHELMVLGRMVLGEIIGKIVTAFLPVDSELALADAIADPVEAHVDGFGAALLDSVVDDAFGTGVVSLDWSGGLGPAHGDECVSKDTGVLGVDEEGAEFGFGGGGEDSTHDTADDMDGSIEWRSGGIGQMIVGDFAAEMVEASSARASFGLGVVGGVALDLENHVAGVVAKSGVGIGGSVVEKMGCSFGCCLGAAGLGRGERAEGDEHGGVNGAGVEEEGADDCLESSDFGSVKFGGGVFFFGELGRGTVERLGPGRGSMLGAAFGRMFETSEGFGDVAGHGEIDSAGFVVPFERDATVEGAGPIGCHFVFGGDDVDEVLGIFSSNILDTEIVDDEAENDRANFVLE